MAEGQKDNRFLKGRKSVKVPGYFGCHQYKLEDILATLAVPRRCRSASQIDQLASFTKDIKVFRELCDQLSTEAHLQCCECLSSLFCPAGQFVFHEGDPGDKFYVILSGSVSVIVSAKRMDGKTELKQVAVLRQGEGFGELALISNQARIASIACREDAYFAVLSREDYTRILSKSQAILMETKIAILTRQGIFRHLSKSALQRLSYFFRIQRFKRKQVVFEAGMDSDFLYLVKEGEFQLTKDVEMRVYESISPASPKTAKVRIDVTLITVGEFIGSEEVVGRRPYRYTCVCYSTTGELLSIAKKDFFHLLGNEETLTYFSTLGKVREEYRQARVTTVKKVEREKRAILLSPGKDVSMIATHQTDTSVMNHTHRSSDMSTSAILSHSFSSQLLSPKRQSSIRALLESTSGKKMVIRTQSDKLLSKPRPSVLLKSGFKSQGNRVKLSEFQGFIRDMKAKTQRKWSEPN